MSQYIAKIIRLSDLIEHNHSLENQIEEVYNNSVVLQCSQFNKSLLSEEKKLGQSIEYILFPTNLLVADKTHRKVTSYS